MAKKKVHIRHPETEGEAYVFESALPHLRPGGWEVVDAPASPAPAAAEESTDTAAGGSAAADAGKSSADGEPADVAPTTTQATRPGRKNKE